MDDPADRWNRNPAGVTARILRRITDRLVDTSSTKHGLTDNPRERTDTDASREDGLSPVERADVGPTDVVPADPHRLARPPLFAPAKETNSGNGNCIARAIHAVEDPFDLV